MIIISIQRYNNAQPIANKILNNDGSITTMQGETPALPTNTWLNAKPLVNKTLEPDGSIGVFNFGNGALGGSDDVPEAPKNDKLYPKFRKF